VSEFPGLPRQAAFTTTLGASSPAAPLPCYRALDDAGRVVEGGEPLAARVSEEDALRMYGCMIKLQAMDAIFYEAQRQGRFSFYMTAMGEEANNVGSAAALDDGDVVFAQYREAGVLLWRGWQMGQFADQCFGNERDQGKGRQMPVHYGDASLNFHTISSPLATQLPQAVGAAYGLKMEGSKNLAVAYFGDGAASEGDFHAAVNFAATLEVPMLFICRNNGWAISTPTSDQFRGDGIAGRAGAYGLRAVRCDGNDALAVREAVAFARAQAIETGEALVVECMTYRSGHHSTSDDSSRYRASSEIAHWKTARDPVQRFRAALVEQGWWDDEREKAARKAARREVVKALDEAEGAPKPGVGEMFADVYHEQPPYIKEQEQEMLALVRRFPAHYEAAKNKVH
jgi:2-oxoisovalerate dehydrogenase E1 component alpha subunit